MRLELPHNLLVLALVFQRLATAVSIRDQLRIEQKERERVKALTQARFGQGAQFFDRIGHISTRGQQSYYQRYEQPSHYQGNPVPEVQEPDVSYRYYDPTTMQYNPVISAQDDLHAKTQRGKDLVIEEPQNDDSSPSSHGDTSDSDYQEEALESPRRTRATGKAKGKAVAVMAPSESDHQMSISDDDKFEFSDFGQSIHSSVKPGARIPQKRGRQRAERKDSTGHPEQDLARAFFLAEWNRHGLGPHMTPTELADEAALIRIPDVKAKGKGRWAKQIAESYYRDSEKLVEFKMRQRRLIAYAHKIRSRMAKNDKYQEMNSEDLHSVSMEKAVKHLNNEVEPASSSSNTNLKSGEMKQRNYSEERLDEVGAFVFQYLARLGKSISNLTLDQLDVLMRNKKIRGMNEKTFTNHFFGWLHRRMNVSNEDIDILRIHRENDKNERRIQARHERYYNMVRDRDEDGQ